MAGMLTDTQKDVLEHWIGKGAKYFTLIFSLSRDGLTGRDFHRKCDNQGPTVTVVYNDQGCVYGGYASVSWASSGKKVRDDNAFLYQLQYLNNQKTTKFPVQQPNNAILDNNNCGPVFGGSGHDLWIFNNATKSAGKYVLDGNMNSFGTSYNSQGNSASDINNGSSVVTEVEVYKVTDCHQNCVRHMPKQPKQTLKPWRKTPEWNTKYMQKLVDEIVSLKPEPEVGVKDFRLLLLGPVGGGKSSFINTVNSLFAGRITKRASCGNQPQSTTTTYTPYTLRSRSPSKINVRLCDTPGFGDTSGLDLIDCNYLLEGHIPENYLFHHTAHITWKSAEFVHKPSLKDQVHCGVFVFDATSVTSVSSQMVDKVNGFKKLMDEKQIPCSVILTHTGNLSEDIADDLSLVFRNEKVKQTVDKVSELFGIARNSVLPVKNYEEEIELDENVNILAVMALRQLMYSALDHVENLTAAQGGATGREDPETTESDTA